MKIKVSKKQVLITIGVITGIAAASVCGIKYGYNNNSDFKNMVDSMTNKISDIFPSNNEENSYITDTAFDGSENINKILFSYPFSRDDNGYISNKDLFDTVSDEKMQAVADRATTICEGLYTFDYREVANNYDTELNTRSNYFVNTTWDEENKSTGDLSTDEYIAGMFKTFSDAKLQMTATFDTSKFLVYENGYDFVRGILTIEVYNIKDDADLKDWFPCKLEEGKTYKFVYDSELLYIDNLNTDEMSCVGYDWIDNISDNANEVENKYLLVDTWNTDDNNDK